jgi:hypothetical protein
METYWLSRKSASSLADEVAQRAFEALFILFLFPAGELDELAGGAFPSVQPIVVALGRAEDLHQAIGKIAYVFVDAAKHARLLVIIERRAE